MRHFLDLADWASDDIQQLLDLALSLKHEWKNGGNKPILAGKTLAMIFQKPSLRTRVSFDVGMNHLGGYAIMLGPNEIGLGKRESIADVARVLSGYVHGMMARVFDHAHVLELSEYATVPVINGLSDANHPCQALADVLTIYEHFGRLEGLNITFVGDGNNVAASLLMASIKLGANFTLAAPAGYSLPEETLDRAASIAKNGAQINVVQEPRASLDGADVIYTDTWVSMGQEAQAAEKRQHFANYQVNETLVAAAKRDAIVMHCLPAHRGDEITDAVADGAQSVIFQQAENRLHAQKAILVELMQ